jgi:hypothetical protein
MTNDQMKAGRFLKLAKGRKMFRFILANLEAGNSVSVTTYTRSVNYKAEHKTMFKLGVSGSVYVQRGKNWDCIDLCRITAFGDSANLKAA